MNCIPKQEQLRPEFIPFLTELLKYEIHVHLDRAVLGFWDHGAKSHFEWSPRIVVVGDDDYPCVQWASYEANAWFRKPLTKVPRSAKSYLAGVKRSLQGNSPRRFTVVNTDEEVEQ